METQNVITTKPLVIVDMNRFITQSEYCKRNVGMNLQNLRNMITRNQIKHLYIKEFGMTLIEVTVEMTLPKGEFTQSQLGEHFAKFAMQTLLKNSELELLLQEKESLLSKQKCELSKQSKMITDSNNLISEATQEMQKYYSQWSDCYKILQEKESLVNKQKNELTKQHEIITQNSLVISQLEEKIKSLEAENAKTTDIQDIKENMARFSELLSGFQLAKDNNISASQTPQQQEELWFVQYGVFLQPSNNLQKAIQNYFHKMNKNNTLISDTGDFVENTKSYINLLSLENKRCTTPEKVSVSKYNDITNSFSLSVGEKVNLRFIKVKS
jgi:hypothetical protein